MKPLVSIVVASYNKAQWISETIDSVIKQSYPYWELILVDDASSDETPEIIRKYSQNEKRIKPFLNETNKGANFCRNAGIKISSGTFLIFLDADDILDTNCITKRVKAMEDHPELDFSVHSMFIFEMKIGDRNYVWSPNSKKPLEDFLRHKLPWQTMQPIWKKNFLEKLNGFDESFKRLQDVEMHTRALLMDRVSFLLFPGKPDCYFRVHEGRKNYNAFQFLERWIDSVVAYCNKFKVLIPKEKHRLILGTVFQGYLQILNQFKLGKIQKSEFQLLERRLINAFLDIDSNWRIKATFKFCRYYNLHFRRIPGVNRILSNSLTW